MDEGTSDRGEHKQAVKEAFVHRGHTDADAVVVGGFGAVPITGDKHYEYYICRWSHKPEKMKKTTCFALVPARKLYLCSKATGFAVEPGWST